MLFKNELPSPRYALDADLADEEFPYEASYEVTLDTGIASSPSPDVLLLVAPRLHELLPAVLGTASFRRDAAIGALSVRETVRFRPQFVSAPPEESFYEADAAPADFAKHSTHTAPLFRGPRGLVAVALPATTTPALDAVLGRELVDRLRPASVVLAAPGASFMDAEVCHLAARAEVPPAVRRMAPAAVPPAAVQGAGAAAVSRAVQRAVPAVALVLRSEGAVHHEAFTAAALALLRRALLTLLGVAVAPSPQEVERRVSALYM